MAGDSSKCIILHATCISVAGRGALLMGPSGAGKSDLALRLIHGNFAAAGPVDLVADDQVLIERRHGRLAARAPPALAGLIEVRGLGILTVPFAAETEPSLLVELVEPAGIERLPDPLPTADILGHRLPRLRLAPFEVSAALKVLLALARLDR